MSSESPNAPLMMLRDAAAVLAISPRKLWQLTKDSMIPCVRIGRSVRYDPRDLAAYVERAKSAPGTEGGAT